MSEYIKFNPKIIDKYGSVFPSPVIHTYIGLLRFADRKGIISEDRTQQQWADAIGIGKTTFARSLQILKAENLIEVVKPRNPADCCGYIIKEPGEQKPSRKHRLFIEYKKGKRNSV